MDIRTQEVADGIYRFSTFVPDIGPTGFTFNQYLIVDEEPLLFHTGLRHLFPEVTKAIAALTPIESLRWVMFGHLEADENGSMNELLEVAPRAEVAHGATGCMVSLNDLALRPPCRLPMAKSSNWVHIGFATSIRLMCRTDGKPGCSSKRPRARSCAVISSRSSATGRP